MSRNSCDLLVIGLGPVGDVLAGLAAQQGMSVIAIERETALHPYPRAAVFDHEIMRIFQMLRVSARIEPLCRAVDRYQFLTTQRDVLLDFDVSAVAETSAWRQTYALHQPAVEQVLRERLHELDVDVRLGVRFSSLSQDANGVDVVVESPQGVEKLHARYVVGCDGAASAVRQALGIELFDYNFDEPWLVVDGVAESASPLPLTCMQICDPAQPVTYLAMSPPRYRWEFMLKPGDDPAQFCTNENIGRLLEHWEGASQLRFERRAVYRFHGLVAKDWRKERVFLAGDAAHQMPPFAGQGMCSGIRDACNLVWKLSHVLSGRANASILDTYQREREPHVRAIIETAIAMGRIVCTLDPLAAAQRDSEMLARKASGAQDVSMAYPDLRDGFLMDTPAAGALFPQAAIADVRFDDAVGPGFWLVGHKLDTTAALDHVIRCDLDSAHLSPFAAQIDAWLDQYSAPAALVRPDRHVFGVGTPKDLLTALAKFFAA